MPLVSDIEWLSQFQWRDSQANTISYNVLSLPDLTLQWRHNERNGVSHPRCLHYLLNCWFRRRSKKTSKKRVTGLCVGNSPRTKQKACNAENVSIWWRHHGDLAQNCIIPSALAIVQQWRYCSLVLNHWYRRTRSWLLMFMISGHSGYKLYIYLYFSELLQWRWCQTWYDCPSSNDVTPKEIILALIFNRYRISHYNGVIMNAMASHIPGVAILLNCWFRRRSKKTSKIHVTGLGAGNSPVTC